jgi:hypothetical protein
MPTNKLCLSHSPMLRYENGIKSNPEAEHEQSREQWRQRKH